MKICGEPINTVRIIEKVLQPLAPKFDHFFIEEYKNLDSMKIKELQGSLEEHEQPLDERSSTKKLKQSGHFRLKLVKGWEGNRYKHSR